MNVSKLKIAIVFCFLSACGDPVDVPSDCSNTEYFDDVRQLCFGCAPIVTPECPAACGFEIVIKDKESSGIERCPVAECSSVDTCDICQKNEYFSNTTLSCLACIGETECEGEKKLQRRITDGQCYTSCR